MENVQKYLLSYRFLVVISAITNVLPLTYCIKLKLEIVLCLVKLKRISYFFTFVKTQVKMWFKNVNKNNRVVIDNKCYKCKVSFD